MAAAPTFLSHVGIACRSLQAHQWPLVITAAGTRQHTYIIIEVFRRDASMMLPAFFLHQGLVGRSVFQTIKSPTLSLHFSASTCRSKLPPPPNLPHGMTLISCRVGDKPQLRPLILMRADGDRHYVTEMHSSVARSSGYFLARLLAGSSRRSKAHGFLGSLSEYAGSPATLNRRFPGQSVIRMSVSSKPRRSSSSQASRNIGPTGYCWGISSLV